MISEKMKVLVRSLNRQLKFDKRFQGNSLERLLDDWSFRCVSDDLLCKSLADLAELTGSWAQQVAIASSNELAGRCWLCGTPSLKANGPSQDGRAEWTIGPCCKTQVDKAFEDDSLREDLTPDEDCPLVCPGWAPFNGKDQEAELQRCDSCNRFSSDQEAASYVAKILGVEPKFPRGY